MKYAPIVIITLNRFEHLKNCIDSLKKCRHAELTEVYISVDYPPNDSYYEGYCKIVEFLKSDIDGFKDCHVFFQSQNIGAEANFLFVKAKAKEKHDVFIFSEDDNVFSPNFLDYANKGLELFASDEKIAALSGYNEQNHERYEDSNVGLTYGCNMWGVAGWFKKDDEIIETISRNHFKELAKDRKFVKSLYGIDNQAYWVLIEAVLSDPTDKKNVFYSKTGNLRIMDYTYRVIMFEKHIFSIRPALSMVRNCGIDDNSGEHKGSVSDYKWSEQPIDTSAEFEYEIGPAFKEKVYSIYKDINPRVKRAKSLYTVFWIFGEKLGRKYFQSVLKLEYKMYLYKRRVFTGNKTR